MVINEYKPDVSILIVEEPDIIVVIGVIDIVVVGTVEKLIYYITEY